MSHYASLCIYKIAKELTPKSHTMEIFIWASKFGILTNAKIYKDLL